MEQEAFLETGTDTPCPPVRRTGKGSAEDPKAPTLQAVYRGCRGSYLASQSSRMPYAPTGGPGRLPMAEDTEVSLDTSRVDGEHRGPWSPWEALDARVSLEASETLDARVSLETLETRVSLESLGSMGSVGILGHLGHLGGIGDPGLQGVLGVLGALGGLGRHGILGVDGERRRAPGPIIAKTVFRTCF